MDRIVDQLKALGEENRFRIALMLLERPLCVCEILEVLKIAGGTLSGHLKVLSASGLIKGRKDGKWVEYYLASTEVGGFIRQVQGFMEDFGRYAQDLEKIRGLNRESCSLRVKREP